MRRRRFSVGEASAAVVVLLLAAAASAGQEPALSVGASHPGSLASSLQRLEAQVEQLSATLRQVQAEAARSHNEVRELRQELQATREQLTSFRSGLGAAPVAPAPSAGAETPLRAGNAAEHPQAPTDNQRPAADLQAAKQTEGRLARLEEEQQLLVDKTDDQYQTKVESGSKYRVRLSGIALLNVLANRGAADNQDLPNFARDRTPFETNGNFGFTLRQSLFGVEVFGPKLAGAKTSANVQFDFFGGFPNTSDGITAGLLRLRVATAHLDWPHTSVVAGQDAPFFSPLSPTSLASLAYPPLSYAGNLWTWTPQIRVEHRVTLSEGSSLLFQGGILDALTGQPPYNPYYRTPQAGEAAGQPAYATRLAWTHNAFGRPLTIGAGGYYASQNWGFGRRVDAWAGTADWTLPLGQWFSLTGEFYRGRAIGGLGAADGRSVLFNGPLTNPQTQVLGLNTAGGWSQLKFRPAERLEFNAAFGEDQPFASDLRLFPVSQTYVNGDLGRNQNAFVNTIYHARSNLLLSLEYRRLWTLDTQGNKYTVNHVNLGVGVLF